MSHVWKEGDVGIMNRPENPYAGHHVPDGALVILYESPSRVLHYMRARVVLNDRMWSQIVAMNELDYIGRLYDDEEADERDKAATIEALRAKINELKAERDRLKRDAEMANSLVGSYRYDICKEHETNEQLRKRVAEQKVIIAYLEGKAGK